MSLLSRPSRTINIPIPQLPLLLSSLLLSPRYIRQKGRKTRRRERRRDVSVSSTGHKVPFVFRFRDLPRTSIAVGGAVVRAFLHPPAPGSGERGGRVNTLIDALNGERTRRRTRGERGREIGRKKGGGKLDSIEREPRG